MTEETLIKNLLLTAYKSYNAICGFNSGWTIKIQTLSLFY